MSRTVESLSGFLKQLLNIVKEWQKVNSGLFLILAIIVGFLMGIQFEYKLSISRHIPYYSSAYELREEKEKAAAFVSKSKVLIGHWKEHYMGTDNLERQEVYNLMVDYSLFYQRIDQSKLSTLWKIWVQYFYAYLQFICADLDKKKNCVISAIEAISLIESFNLKNIKEDDLEWIEDQSIFRHLRVLKAHVYAVQFDLAPTALNKTSAISALKALGGQQLLIDGHFHRDRILKPVYDLAYQALSPPVKPIKK